MHGEMTSKKQMRAINVIPAFSGKQQKSARLAKLRIHPYTPT
jgi:hypothetical protein